MKAGAGYLVVAMALTPVADGLAKALALHASPFTVVFARYFMAGVVALIVAFLLNKPLYIPREGRLGQVFRTALLMGAMVLLIFALSEVSMAKAVGGFLTAPVVASLLAVVIYRERLDGYRILGSLLSFTGGYIILRPEGSLEPGALMALCGGFLLGCYLVFTRHARACGGLFPTLVVQSFLGAAMLAPLAYWNAPAEPQISMLVPAIALGGISASCHFLTVAAYKRTEASVLAPFFYFNIVFAIPVGYFWFNEVPGLNTMMGLAGIIIGGLVVLMSDIHSVGILRQTRSIFRRYILKAG